MTDINPPKKKSSRKKAPLKPSAKSKQALVPKTACANLPIVGIGASAGGLEAFESFFKAMPADSDMAFILVSHLDPSHISLLPELLQKVTKMPVSHVKDGVVVKPNCVYVIPPNKDLYILQGRLQLVDRGQPPRANLPIDTFFRSLAEDQGSNAVCIILSGTGTDGTLGLKAIKEEVGMVMVQDAKSAKYDGMPRSAIATGQADFVLPASDMPDKLVSYFKRATPMANRGLGPTKSGISDGLQKILIILRSRTGHDFSLYKMNTICRRIERRMNLHHINEITDYVRYLQESDSEADILFKELLIGVTNFFRDPDAFEALKKLLPSLWEGKPNNYTLRIWVAGCSSGEEAYSIAILLLECMDELQCRLNIQIFGTDIDQDAIALARAGLYPSSIAADVDLKRLQRFFIEEEDGQYRVQRSVRELLVFAQQNVIKDPPFTKLDLLCCRNLLIYFGSELQRRLLPVFHYSVNPNGLLFLGSSENVGQNTDQFIPEQKKWKIFRCKSIDTSFHPQFNLSTSPLGEETIGARKVIHAEELSALQLVETILDESDTPPCAIIDDTCTIVYIHGRTGRYLELADGKISVNILEMARSGLKTVLAMAIRKVSTTGEQVSFNDQQVQFNGDYLSLNLTVKPILGPGRTKGLMMVIFREDKIIDNGATGTAFRASERKGNKTLTELEQELQYNRENLQSTIEELETSNEELKSTNEELQSTNEELQSTNEEMETSKEELQSLNEESVTVNAELQSRIDQLTEINDDMKNLLDSTEIATIFLDTNLCIRRFTPKSANIIPLVGMDTGRPIKHFATNLIDIDLTKIAEQVLRDLAVMEVEVQSNDGHYFYMRLRPYRTVADVVDGVVITFDDITDRQKAENERQMLSVMLKRILDTLPEALAVKRASSAYTLANAAFCDFLGKQEEDIVDKTDFDLFPRHSAEKYLNIESEVVQSGREHSVDEEISGAHGKQLLRITKVPIYDETTGQNTIILVSLNKLPE